MQKKDGTSLLLILSATGQQQGPQAAGYGSVYHAARGSAGVHVTLLAAAAFISPLLVQRAYGVIDASSPSPCA